MRGEMIVDRTSINGIDIDLVSTELRRADILGAWKARWGINRMSYKVSPGLYGIGSPGTGSPVLVTANYKLTFDRVRSSLKGLDAWILVLDTKGINVWCAAGKGTFGTEELVKRVKESGLERVVSHRTLILPQLGATGVAGHLVRRESGFKVVYGPVDIRDLPAFLAAGLKKTEKMKRVTFTLWERAVLTPLELKLSLKFLIPVMALIFILTVIEERGLNSAAWLSTIPMVGAFLTGCLLVPLFLPYLPFRSFALKGVAAGLLLMTILTIIFRYPLPDLITHTLLVLPVTSYLALNFTGSSTYTSLAGVALEVKIATPLFIISLAAGTLMKTLALIGLI